MCNKSSVISEEEVSDQLLLGLCVGLKSPEIEDVAIEAIADINAIIVVVVVVVDPTPPTCCQQSPAPESCGSQQSLPPVGKERLHFVGIRPEVPAIIVIEVFSSLSQHHAEEDGEESRCQDAALFHAVADCERLGEVTVEPDLATLVVM